jgi:hypothetical protein
MMTYVPDVAITEASELPDDAFRVYVILCRLARYDSLRSCMTLRLSDEMKDSRTRRMLQALEQKRWIRRVGHTIQLLKGFEEER